MISWWLDLENWSKSMYSFELIVVVLAVSASKDCF